MNLKIKIKINNMTHIQVTSANIASMDHREGIFTLKWEIKKNSFIRV